MTKESTYVTEKTLALHHLATLIGYVVMAVLTLAAIIVLAAYHWLALFLLLGSVAGLIHLHTRQPSMSILQDFDDLIDGMRERGLTPDYLTLPEGKLRRFVMDANQGITGGNLLTVENARAYLRGQLLPAIRYRDIPIRFGHTLGAFRNPKPEVHTR